MTTLRAGTGDDVRAVLAFWLDATAEPSAESDRSPAKPSKALM